jgi:NADH-ubiquinone oxidoreductase chain 2
MDSLALGVGLYGGLFHVTSITQIFHIFIFIISAIILQLTAFYPRRAIFDSPVNEGYFKKYKKVLVDILKEESKIIEYPLIILFIITGGILLLASSDLISIFLSIELQSYGLYLLSTIHRNSEQSTNAGLTYFLLGGLSSCFILLGISQLYANSGTTNLDGIFTITSLSDFTFISNSLEDISLWYKSNNIDTSLTILSVGFLFKVGAAPFHN